MIKNMVHPCDCTAGNGEQCYNCLNGFHEGCDHGCKQSNSKQLGLPIVVKHEKPRVTKKPKKQRVKVELELVNSMQEVQTIASKRLCELLELALDGSSLVDDDDEEFPGGLSIASILINPAR